MSPAPRNTKRESEPRDVGPECKCGHGLYEHYMCGEPKSSWCYKGKECGCKQFNPKRP